MWTKEKVIVEDTFNVKIWVVALSKINPEYDSLRSDRIIIILDI